jgi:integrase
VSSIEKYQLRSGELRYKVRFRDAEGKQHQRKGFKTKKEAKLAASKVEVKVASGQWIDPRSGRVTVATIYADWLAGLAHVKATTKATRETTWAAHVEPRWAATAVGRIRPSQVRSWVGQMVADGAGVSTIENALGVLRGILAMAVEDRLIDSNPAAGVKPPRRMPKIKKFLTHKQVDLIVAEMDDAEDIAITTTLAYCGLRAGELAALRVQDVNFLRRRINVSRSVSDVRGQGLVWTATKTYENRSVPIPAFLLPLLSVQATGRSRDDLLFGDGQTPVRVNNWRRRVWHPALAAARKIDETIPKMTVHDLRATAISLAISAGASLKAVQLLAGHASAAVSADTYASLLPDDLDRVSAALERQRAAETGRDPGVTPQVGG